PGDAVRGVLRRVGGFGQLEDELDRADVSDGGSVVTGGCRQCQEGAGEEGQAKNADHGKVSWVRKAPRTPKARRLALGLGEWVLFALDHGADDAELFAAGFESEPQGAFRS